MEEPTKHNLMFTSLEKLDRASYMQNVISLEIVVNKIIVINSIWKKMYSKLFV